MDRFVIVKHWVLLIELVIYVRVWVCYMKRLLEFIVVSHTSASPVQVDSNGPSKERRGFRWWHKSRSNLCQEFVPAPFACYSREKLEPRKCYPPPQRSYGLENDGTNFHLICANWALRFQHLCHLLSLVIRKTSLRGPSQISKYRRWVENIFKLLFFLFMAPDDK